MSRSLFILKRREDYSSDPSYSGSYQIATGMYNSANFVVDELVAAGHEAEIAILDNHNLIDGAVTAYNPDFVFIEGLWVTPEKIIELLAIPRHQPRKWVIRIHSEIPFLATEGIAMGWIGRYLQAGALIAPNAQRADDQIRYFANRVGLTLAEVQEKVIFLPNCYPTDFEPLAGLDTSAKATLDVGCFGAFRPFKNHLQQVFVAAKFADQLGKTLRFHTNCRYDQGGISPSKNVHEGLIAMGIEHVEHNWEDRNTFLQSLRDNDLLLQVSMTETFNIVAADNTLVGRPMLTSDEIPWVYPLYGDPQNVDDCVAKLAFIWGRKEFFIQKNRARLTTYAQTSREIWTRYVTI